MVFGCFIYGNTDETFCKNFYFSQKRCTNGKTGYSSVCLAILLVCFYFIRRYETFGFSNGRFLAHFFGLISFS